LNKEFRIVSDRTEPQTGREARLLILVVGVAVAVLLLLAQWRFPGAGLSVVSPNAAPLAGLAARATFDELASAMTDVINRTSPLTMIVSLEPDVVDETATGAARGAARGGAARGRAAGGSAKVPEPQPAGPAMLVLALRVRGDLALLHVPAGMRLQRLESAPLDVVAHDAAREMMLIRVPPSGSATETLSGAVRTFPSFAYVAALGATSAGPTVQPVFVGRADTVEDARWSHGLVPAAVAPGTSAGTLLFSLNGHLVGMVVGGASGPMVVPAPALEAFVEGLGVETGASQ
jgi:hypothetical protein